MQRRRQKLLEEAPALGLVAEQLRVAAGEKLSFTQDDITLSGVAVEFRINAEDPDQDFFPSPGHITRFDPPSGPGVRVDSGFVAGGEITPFYDSLLAKVIVHGEDRAQALARAGQALSELLVEGVTTTRAMHVALLQEPDLKVGGVSTTWYEEREAAQEED